MRCSKESEGEVSIAEWRSVVMRRTVCLYSGETRIGGMSTHDATQIRYLVKEFAPPKEAVIKVASIGLYIKFS